MVGAGLEGEALEALLERTGSVHVVGSATPAEAREEVAANADVVLVDTTVPEGLNAVRRIAAAGPAEASVVALGDPDDRTLVACVAAGAGYVAHGSPLRELLATLEAAARGDLVISPGTARALRPRRADVLAHAAIDEPPFTRREREVVGLVAEGLTDKEIGARLYIERSTVKKHVHNILRKLEVRRRGDVAAVLRRSDETPRR